MNLKQQYYIFLIPIVLIFLLSFFYKEKPANEDVSITVSLDNKDDAYSFTSLIGGNIAHSGEKMGVWPDSVFRVLKHTGIRHFRLHDTKSLDWDIIFPDWDADPHLPENYSFEDSDRIISYMVENGFVPFIRLGVSVSAKRNNREVGLCPPDPKKWTIIVTKIMEHYMEGWADGYHYPIEYVEIWNEPDLGFWTGSPDEFYELSYSALTNLKEKFPELKVGLCGISNIRKNKTFAEGLLSYLSDPNQNGKDEDKVEIDFFSWHVYEIKRGVSIFKEFTLLVQDLLDKYGYGDVESICTEWNADLPSEYINSKAAAVDVGMTLLWAEEFGLDGLFFYPLIDDWGMFVPNKSKSSDNVTYLSHTHVADVHKMFDNFKLVTSYLLKSSVKTSGDNVQILAAVSEDNDVLQTMVAHQFDQVRPLKLKVESCTKKKAKYTILDVDNGAEKVREEGIVDVLANGIVRLEIDMHSQDVFVVKLEFF
ncbi:hypothetical protein RCC89_08945 [Cytophagaceae bacterium ABcell3]|nr:hypothetical protein RCC89_08945 [Cytophagaceae bacterium ABcell3]